jgi:hypothetical protein
MTPTATSPEMLLKLTVGLLNLIEALIPLCFLADPFKWENPGVTLALATSAEVTVVAELAAVKTWLYPVLGWNKIPTQVSPTAGVLVTSEVNLFTIPCSPSYTPEGIIDCDGLASVIA